MRTFINNVNSEYLHKATVFCFFVFVCYSNQVVWMLEDSIFQGSYYKQLNILIDAHLSQNANDSYYDSAYPIRCSIANAIKCPSTFLLIQFFMQVDR